MIGGESHEVFLSWMVSEHSNLRLCFRRARKLMVLRVGLLGISFHFISKIVKIQMQ